MKLLLSLAFKEKSGAIEHLGIPPAPKLCLKF